jgi:phospholipid/cholesterol/gamma-HCH transport system substrate-binding protein
MRSRTIREGSVGLLILVGLGILAGLVLWLRGFQPGNRRYRVTIDFPDVAGMQTGAPVRYRGVTVGRIVAVRPGTNAVEVDVEISPATLVMPTDVDVQANQSGLIGETSVDIIPQTEVSKEALAANPLSPDCSNQVIICNGAHLQGEIGVSFNQLITSSTKFADLFSNPQFFAELRDLTRNTSAAAVGVTNLTGEVSSLARSVQQDLRQVSRATTSSSTSISEAASQIGLTASQVNGLLTENRTALVSTLTNISRTSEQLQSALGGISSASGQSGAIIQNLEVLSANAAQASENLRNLTETVGTPENLLLLQQTLDSARATFQNVQKITSDVDELTGDPQFRQNLRNLVNGLSGLVSSTQQLQQQAAIAQVLAPAEIALNQSGAAPTVNSNQAKPADRANRANRANAPTQPRSASSGQLDSNFNLQPAAPVAPVQKAATPAASAASDRAKSMRPDESP